MTSSRSRVFFAALCIAAAALSGGDVFAQDAITVGTVVANGRTVDVPVRLRDVGGTPLGMDQPAASRIQSFSIRVTYSPASAVSSVTFSRAGITAGLQPVFETSPSASGAISLLASFQQASNPIPFTLNASPPGDLIAHLVFTLSASAAPGSVISLELDDATTQLTDEGGTGATKETTANGQLALVDGAIQIPVPSLSLSPSTQNVTAGNSGALSIDTGTRLIADTNVTLTSSNPLVASVPASATLPANSQRNDIVVTALAPGTTTITATLPSSAGGASATAEIVVVEAPDCPAPPAPVINGPASAITGATYEISWTPVANATEFIIEEAANPIFTGATSRTVTTTSASYAHGDSGVRYYYRVRARNRTVSCDEISPASSTISVLITAVATQAFRVIPVVGSTAGSAGSLFRTSLLMFNPQGTTISGKIVFHPQGASGSPADPSLAYSIAPGRTVAFADLLPALGIPAGLGSADLIADGQSPIPTTLARIFNDGGASGTSGLALESMAPGDALKQGETGALLAPSDLQGFRFNVGVRTLDQGATLRVTVRDREGTVVKTLTRAYPATYFLQTGSSAFLDGLTLVGRESLLIEVTQGSAFVYGSTTDNVTNDPSVQFARRID